MTDRSRAKPVSDAALDTAQGGARTTASDLDNGRMVCEIGVAPLKPPEFVIFRIGQKTADAQD